MPKRKPKKDLIRVEIVATIEMSKLNEFKNRYASFAAPYVEGPASFNAQTRGKAAGCGIRWI